MPTPLTNLVDLRPRPVHLLWLAILVLSTVLQAADLVPAWRYDRHLVSDHHWWLLFSGHLVHLNWTHWALNMAGLAIVAVFFSAYDRLWQWLLVIGVSAAGVGLGVHWWNPEIATYVGLSGVLHGLFIYGALREISRYPLSGIVLSGLLVGKLAWERVSGPLPGSEELVAGHVVTDAHLYGAVYGAACYALLWLLLAKCSRGRQSKTGQDEAAG